MTKSTGSPIVRGAAVLSLLAALASPAAAQEGSLVRSVLGTIGLIDEERAEIEYKERAPLVVPPSTALRPPEAAVARRPAAWPEDADLVRRRKAEAERRVPTTESAERRLADRPLLPAGELRAGRPGAPVARTPTEPVYRPGDSSREEIWVRPDILRAQGRKAEPALVAGAEPERRYLTEPPAGLRKPSAAAPVGSGAAAPPKLTEAEEASPLLFWRRFKSED